LSKAKPGEYKSFIKDDPSIELFVESLAEFDRQFCDHMVKGNDFTLRLEIRGDKSELLHVRVMSDGFKRPNSNNSEAKEKC